MTFSATQPFSATQDPSARLDYTWDWRPWLAAINDSIDEAAVYTPEGLTAVGEPVTNDGLITQRVEGGVLGETYKMVCRITTVGGLIDEKTINLTILNQ
jgi:hypothetical protein